MQESPPSGSVVRLCDHLGKGSSDKMLLATAFRQPKPTSSSESRLTLRLSKHQSPTTVIFSYPDDHTKQSRMYWRTDQKTFDVFGVGNAAEHM